MINWESKIEVKKGNIGEEIVKNILEERGYLLYKCITEKAHIFDYLAINENTKRKMLIEIKTKPKMNYYNGTGFDYRSYKKYKQTSEEMGLYIYCFFVDENMKEVYGNFLRKLEVNDDKKYPLYLEKQKIIVFSMKNMKRNIKTLTEDECKKIKSFNTRNYNYQGKL